MENFVLWEQRGKLIHYTYGSWSTMQEKLLWEWPKKDYWRCSLSYLVSSCLPKFMCLICMNETFSWKRIFLQNFMNRYSMVNIYSFHMLQLNQMEPPLLKSHMLPFLLCFSLKSTVWSMVAWQKKLLLDMWEGGLFHVIFNHIHLEGILQKPFSMHLEVWLQHICFVIL